MSALNPARWAELSPQIDELLTLPPLQRAQRLDEIAANDPRTAGELRELLAASADASRAGFMGGAAEPAFAPAPLAPQAQAGWVLGAWTLVDPIGEGGMGAVWRARRSDGRYAGEAAIKLLKGGLFDRSAQERFRREGGILARLHHPGIAQLLDAGVSPQGQPYLVLELVQGQRIDRWCEAQGLNVRQRIELFLQVLDAVQAAHAQLAIHRDLKPSNILVDDSGRVKLLDFGIARLLPEAQAEQTALTREGSFALTPEYAAPEQFEGGVLSVATDVYGLGVVLFELLAGAHPSGLPSGAGALQFMRSAAEGHTLRLSAAARAQSAALRGDLDNILAKTLRTQPAERYASVAALADDLRRHLDHLPVSARPDDALYRAGKFVQRHRMGTSLGVLALLAVLAGVAGTWLQASRAQQAALLANAERQRAMVAAADAQSERATALRERQAAEASATTAEQQRARAEAAATTARREAARADQERGRAASLLMRSLGSEHFSNDLLRNMADAGKPLGFQDLLKRGEALALRADADPRYQAGALMLLVSFYGETGDGNRAVSLAKQAVQAAEKTADASLVLQAHCLLGYAYAEREDADLAESELRQTLRRAGSDAQAQSLCWPALAVVAMRKRDGGAMLEASQRSLAAVRQLPFQAPGQLGPIYTFMGDGHRLLDQIAQADQHYRLAIDTLDKAGLGRSTAAINVITNQGVLWGTVGHIQRALVLSQQALALTESSLGAEAVTPALLLSNARYLWEMNRLDEAWAMADRAEARAQAAGVRPVQALVEQVRMRVRLAQGRVAEARRHFETYAQRVGNPPPTALPAMSMKFGQAAVLRAEGRHAEALQALEEVRPAIATLARRPGAQNSLRAVQLSWYRDHAELLADNGRAPEALAEVQQALDYARRLQADAPASAKTGDALLLQARLLRASGRMNDALEAAREAQTQLAASLGAGHPQVDAALALQAQMPQVPTR